MVRSGKSMRHSPWVDAAASSLFSCFVLTPELLLSFLVGSFQGEITRIRSLQSNQVLNIGLIMLSQASVGSGISEFRRATVLSTRNSMRTVNGHCVATRMSIR